MIPYKNSLNSLSMNDGKSFMEKINNAGQADSRTKKTDSLGDRGCVDKSFMKKTQLIHFLSNCIIS